MLRFRAWIDINPTNLVRGVRRPDHAGLGRRLDHPVDRGGPDALVLYVRSLAKKQPAPKKQATTKATAAVVAKAVHPTTKVTTKAKSKVVTPPRTQHVTAKAASKGHASSRSKAK
jgi:hypothetical protein